MGEQLYKEVRTWMYRNARPVDLCLWQYFFEQGSKEAVVAALWYYQNDDGGFGHALEADNWNPGSTPITTQHALKILNEIEFFDMEHPIYKGIWRYLNSGKDMLECGWCFTVPDNDRYPHAPWWSYSEEFNSRLYVGLTAEYCAFILRWGDRTSQLYHKAEQFTDALLKRLMSDTKFGEAGVEGYINLLGTVKELGMEQYDCEVLKKILAEIIPQSMEHDLAKWETYVARPSNFITGPDSEFYEDNSEIVHRELAYLKETKPENDVWGITWTWFDNMEKYSKEFAISENWWKGYHAIEKLRFLKAFEDVAE